MRYSAQGGCVVAQWGVILQRTGGLRYSAHDHSVEEARFMESDGASAGIPVPADEG
jgi:hypothetical protein